MKKRQMRQGGSALVYALVAGVLVVVLVGGLYGLRQYDWTPTEVVSKDASKKESKEKPAPTSEKKTSPDQSKTDKQAPTKTEDKTPAVAQSKPDRSSQTLPATGPSLELGRFVAVLALTFAIVSYMTSRQTRWTSRDK